MSPNALKMFQYYLITLPFHLLIEIHILVKQASLVALHKQEMC
jgi:hypothetical protein